MKEADKEGKYREMIQLCMKFEAKYINFSHLELNFPARYSLVMSCSCTTPQVRYDSCRPAKQKRYFHILSRIEALPAPFLPFSLSPLSTFVSRGEDAPICT